MTDRIIVSGIRFHARHGATRLEREIGVRYFVSVEMEKDLHTSMASDSLEDTVDYAKVHQVVLEVARSEPFYLLETLAGEVAGRLLANFPILAVHVEIRKETPVLDGIVDWVGVKIERRQGDKIPLRGDPS
ncbi:MAG: dihydroneopterin aldolase [Acidobacteria bacterium]|nr:MAG: dihydroneopterin aldolase [Acidobacteriota bacterium]